MLPPALLYLALAATATTKAGARPPDTASTLRACSLSRPVCVHAEPRDAGAGAVLAALASAERAWDALTGPLALPPPDPDPETRAWDVYLTSAGSPGTFASEHDAARSAFDRASAFTVVDARIARHGCELDATIARELARAIAFRVTPEIDEGTALAQTSSLARLVVPCAAGRLDDVEVYQDHAERSPADTWRDADPDVGAGSTAGALARPSDAGERYARGASLLWTWLDENYAADPGGLVRATWALSPSRAGETEPDAFDVLRTSLKTLDDVFLAFAVDRALDPAWPSPPRAWDVPWPTSPRTLSSGRPLEPGGAAYLVVRRAGAARGARLRVEVTWEQHAAMRWSAIKLDAAGRPKARLDLHVPHEKSTDVQATIAELDDVDAVLLVATNAGDPTSPFDPDDVVWEPHAFLVTIASE